MKYDKSSRAENPMMDALKAIVLGACFGAVFCMIGLIACALVFMGAKSIPYQMIQQIVFRGDIIKNILNYFFLSHITKQKVIIKGKKCDEHFLLFTFYFLLF